jgi:hypothetical protein
LAGLWLRRSAEEVSGDRKAAGLAIAGVVLLAVGGLWSFVFPLNKNLWTSSFVLWTCGWSSLLLASFYWLIDVRGWLKAFGAFFAVIGMNSVLIYMSAKFINFDFTGQALFGGLARAFPPALASVGAVLVPQAPEDFPQGVGQGGSSLVFPLLVRTLLGCPNQS